MPRIRRCSRSGCWPDPPVQLARYTAFPNCASAGASANETRLLVGPDAPRACGASRPLKAQPAKLLGVALPVFRDLHAQVEVNLCAQQLFDLGARGGADLPQPGTALADDDPLLAVPFDEQQGMHVDQVVAVFPRVDFVDDDRQRMG